VALRDGDLVVGALVAVNAFGDHVGAEPTTGVDPGAAFTNTTIGVIASNAALDKVGCLLVAQSGHDGLARALEPVHATVDGDALVAAAVGPVEVPVDQVRVLAARAVQQAVSSVLG
jgi:L-aminopeptidase/D-esterase-like protein